MAFGSPLGSGNRIMYVLVGAIILFVFLTVILVLRNFGQGTSTEKVTLQFWGVFDEKDAFSDTIRAFEDQNPNIDVIYTRSAFQDYERGTVNALAGGTGPDVWMIHNTWLPKHINKLVPAPDTLPGESEPFLTTRDFRDQFVDVAYEDFVSDEKIYGMPLYVDTMALYYNKDLLNTAGFSRAPKTWSEFNSYVQQLTKLDEAGNITQAGAAIGSARNVNRSTDILMSLMIQSGVRMTNADHTEATFAHSVENQQVGEIALQYYTDFTKTNKLTYCWNESQHYSIDAFSEGVAAMMFNYSHQTVLLRTKASRLNFGVAGIPQLSETDQRTFASYWAPVVTSNSAHSDEAWKFVKFLTAYEGANTYLGVTQRPAARRDIIEIQKNDADLGVFAQQALTARSWYQVDSSAIETLFAEMIDDVNFSRASVKEALQSTETKVNVLMRN